MAYRNICNKLIIKAISSHGVDLKYFLAYVSYAFARFRKSKITVRLSVCNHPNYRTVVWGNGD
jgi:hypothetical protein